MLKINKGNVEIEGEVSECMAEWGLLTECLFKSAEEKNEIPAEKSIRDCAEIVISNMRKSVDEIGRYSND